MVPTRGCNRSARHGTYIAALCAVIVMLRIDTAGADISLPPVTVGAGLQTSAYGCNTGCIYSNDTNPSRRQQRARLRAG